MQPTKTKQNKNKATTKLMGHNCLKNGLAFFWLCLAISLGVAVPIKVGKDDFRHGTLIIDKPGLYELEDVDFRPHDQLRENEPESWMFPNGTDERYRHHSFGLGFFAAVVISANDVVFDLGGNMLRQSDDHSMMQRFFSVIELANSPFPPTFGPANFTTGSHFRAARNVTIRNGVIGQSAHHGIHGNLNTDVFLRNLEINNFEVAGIALNSVNRLRLENVQVGRTRSDVPANGRLSQAIFLLQSISKRLRLGNETSSEIVAAQTQLRRKVHEFLVSRDDPFFRSQVNGVPDGSLASGIMIHSNVNVGDFLENFPGTFAANIEMVNVTLHELVARPVEIGALVLSNGEKPIHVHDPIGAVFEIDAVVDEDYRYKGNALADLQLALASLAHANPGNSLLARNTISATIVAWSKNETTFQELLAQGPYILQGNHDVMFHKTKGVVGVKLDGTSKVVATNVKVLGIKNLADSNQRSHLVKRFGKFEQYHGFDARALSIASSVDVNVDGIAIDDISTSSESRERSVDLLNNNQLITLNNVHFDRFDSKPTSKPNTKGKHTKDPENVGLIIGSGLGGIFLGFGLAALSMLCATEARFVNMITKYERGAKDANV